MARLIASVIFAVLMVLSISASANPVELHKRGGKTNPNDCLGCFENGVCYDPCFTGSR
ncbi:hypothetical protein BC829DRAFT_439882 [Chytridium lagenaria]|nr:hypothetical protein BC829DRAFT_439882 [Chytridium lagenaria]